MEKQIEVVLCCIKCNNEACIGYSKYNGKHLDIPTDIRYICLQCGHDMKIIVRSIETETKTEII